MKSYLFSFTFQFLVPVAQRLQSVRRVLHALKGGNLEMKNLKPTTAWVKKTLALAAFCCLVSASSCLALDVVWIEEHWELKVGGPDEGRSAPQVTMVMSPTNNLNSDYFIFSLNHWNYPEFAAGGLELQRWNGFGWVSSQRSSNHSPLKTDGEVVKWVQRMELVDSTLHFSIKDGQSQTWGQFGGQGVLKTSFPTELNRLNDYLPEISLTGSGIGYAGNRVSSLTLMKLSYATSDGQEFEMVAPIDIDTDIDP